MTDLTYENENGDMVFTSQYLRNKGTCCKTTCRHCPYGHTVTTCGLQFLEVTDNDIQKAQKFIDEDTLVPESSLSSSFLNEAFGAPKKPRAITPKNRGDYLFVLIKDDICALVEKGILQLASIYLGKHYKDQDLSLELVNSYMTNV